MRELDVFLGHPRHVKEDGVKLHDACERSGVKLFVVKQNRFNPTLQLLKKQVEISKVFFQYHQDLVI